MVDRADPGVARNRGSFGWISFQKSPIVRGFAPSSAPRRIACRRWHAESHCPKDDGCGADGGWLENRWHHGLRSNREGRRRGWALAERTAKNCESRLSSREIARLQRLTTGREILSAIGSLKCLPVFVGAALAEGGQSAEILPRGGQVPGLQIPSKLGNVGLALLTLGLQQLVDNKRRIISRRGGGAG
jgi:hypothetical protein